jgi:hypothetical protein
MGELFGLRSRLGDLELQLVLETVSPWLAARVDALARTRAVGLAPELLSFVVLKLTLTPALEPAVDFATERVDGRLSRSLSAHRWSAAAGVGAIESFGAEWADQDPSLQRAITLLAVAVDAPPERREETLEDALTAALDGARDRVVEFSNAIRGPAMGIYAFGVMLPLALIGLLPVLAASGGGVSPFALAVLYDVLIPVGLTASAVWLWARRPAVSDAGFDDAILRHARPRKAAVVGLGVGIVAGLIVQLAGPSWMVPITAGGSGVGAGLAVCLHPAVEARERLDRLEARLPDAVTIVGQKLGEGTPIEAAVDAVAERFDGPLGELFERAAVRQRRTGDPIDRVFLGPDGLLTDVPSQRTAAALSLSTTAATHGPPGGRTLLSVGEYLGSLQDVERAARRELSQTTNTLKQTAVVFAPAIAGVTVALATGMGAVDGSGQPVDVAALGRVVGVYVLQLGIVLPSLSVVLARGFDPVRMGFQSAVALGVGSVVYPLSFVAARTLVYV